MKSEECHCYRCDRERGVRGEKTFWDLNRMYVCPKCGNKRCPNATWHGADCTGSNAPGQAGSRYAVEWPTND